MSLYPKGFKKVEYGREYEFAYSPTPKGEGDFDIWSIDNPKEKTTISIDGINKTFEIVSGSTFNGLINDVFEQIFEDDY